MGLGRVTALRVPAGFSTTLAPGDVLLVDRSGLVPGMIRLGQTIRPSLRPWAAISHVACAYGPEDLVEALTRDVVRSPLSKYHDVPYIHVRTGLDTHDQAQAKRFLDACVGQKYGFLTDAGIALRFLTPGPGLWFGMNGQEICSGLAALMLCRGDWMFAQENPASVAPARLAQILAVPKEWTALLHH